MSLDIDYVNLKIESEEIKKKSIERIIKIFDSGIYILGNEVKEFEKKLQKKFKVDYAVTVNSGTDALILALLANNIGLGDEVITVSNTFFSTVSAIRVVGAVPVFVDIDNSRNIDCTKIEKSITRKTKAIIPVHLGGNPADMRKILLISKKYKIKIIEDAAQSIGSMIENQYVGTFGIAGCFSLHPLKNLGVCGDGGFILTNNVEIGAKLRLLRNHGLRNRDYCVNWGLNSRLDEIQAAIANEKIKYLNSWIRIRQKYARMYFNGLKNLPVQFPEEYETAFNTYNSFVIFVENRDDLMNFLAHNKICTKIHYPVPIHLQEAFIKDKQVFSEYKLKETENQAKRMLSLPIHPSHSTEEINRVIKTINLYYKNKEGQ